MGFGKFLFTRWYFYVMFVVLLFWNVDMSLLVIAPSAFVGGIAADVFLASIIPFIIYGSPLIQSSRGTPTKPKLKNKKNKE